MEVNVEAVKQLIKNKFRNNKSWFAEEVGITYTYLYLIFKGKRKANSMKLCNGLIKYCKDNKLNPQDYIFFEKVG